MNFSDPNTLIYGHNMANKSMFATLLRFRDEEFFNNNELIYIYLPGRILTYKVFAAICMMIVIFLILLTFQTKRFSLPT